MKDFFWRLSGADLNLLLKTKDESQKRFKAIGKIIFCVYILIFVSFFVFTNHAFQNNLMAMFISIFLTFLIGNIYQINLLSLEPNTLPRKKEVSSAFLSYIIRYFTIGLFGVFVSKIIEAMFYYYIILDLNNKSINGFISTKFQNNSEFVHQLLELNKNYPLIWLFTLIVALFFCSPIFLKYKFKKNLEYYRFKTQRDITITKKEYSDYKANLISIYKSLYEKYNGEKIYIDHIVKFSDEPFNTKLKEHLIKHKSAEDFSNLFS